jgi:hypothetical protein
MGEGYAKFSWIHNKGLGRYAKTGLLVIAWLFSHAVCKIGLKIVHSRLGKV